MAEKLWDKIQAIHADHPMAQLELVSWQETLPRWDRFAKLEQVSKIEILKSIHPKAGLDPEYLARSVIVHPELVIVDERIPGLCCHEYLHPDGTLQACGGIRDHRSACPGSGAPLPSATQGVLKQSKAVIILQAENLTSYDHQRQLHITLLSIESHIMRKGYKITQSWTAGPCRFCPECLGYGKCRSPRFRRFSMEGSGMGVFQTCERIAQVTGDEHWSLALIENWALPEQSYPVFKSVAAIGIQ